MAEEKKEITALKKEIYKLKADIIELQNQLTAAKDYENQLVAELEAKAATIIELEKSSNSQLETIESYKKEVAEMKKLLVDNPSNDDIIKEQEELIEQLQKQVALSENNRVPIVSIKGKYESVKTKKTYKFRNNLKQFYGSEGQIFQSEKLMELAAGKDATAIKELERLIKMGSSILQEV